MRALALTLLVTAPLAACGSNGDGPALSAAAEAGRRVYLDSGCSSCHGANGQGGVGPELVGLWGREVVLDDGTTLTADEAYLRESLTDPWAKQVEGYGLLMPPNDLGDDEVDRILDYLEAIGASGADR